MPSTDSPMRVAPSARRAGGRPPAGRASATGRRRRPARRRPDTAMGRACCSSVASTAIDRVRALAAGRHEQVVEVLDRRLRMERHDGVLELLGADHLGQVARDEQDGIADASSPRQTSTRAALVRGQAAGPARARA